MLMTEKRQGPHASRTKLTRNEEIRAAFVAGASGKELVKQFKISRTRVYQLCAGLRRGAK
jgi:Mor family transcriptional regulator